MADQEWWASWPACGSALGVTALSSAIGIMGRNRMKRRNNTENTPNVPKNVKMSTTVGLSTPQLDGRKSRVSDVQMMTKRSNHMPRFTKSESTQTIVVL